MSFFDDDDPPTRATRVSPGGGSSAGGGRRRPQGGSTRVGGGGGSGARAADPATLRTRRLVAAGVALLLLLILIFAVRSCQSARRETALKDYNRDVAALVTDSDREVGQPLFELLGDAPNQGGDLTVAVNQLRLAAEEQVRRARGLDAPDEVQRAQDDLEMVMNFRAQGVRRIGEAVPSALVQGRDNATTAERAVRTIAGQMQAFLASDVVFSQRVQPYISAAFDEEGITGQRIAGSRFLTNFGWLDVNQVAGRLGAPRAGGGTGANSEPAPGRHGHGLSSVSVGDVRLQPGETVNRIPAASNLSFDVTFENQGEHDESEVVVLVTISGSGNPIRVRRTVDQTKAGTEATASIALGQAPPVGDAVTITVQVQRVPGEANVDNNRQQYTALFTR